MTITAQKTNVATEDDHRGGGRVAQSITPTHPAENVQLGDIISNYGSVWQVISHPQYTGSGITFDILWLAIADPQLNTSTVTFSPEWRFELLDRVAVAA